jgi:hypothetical protein
VLVLLIALGVAGLAAAGWRFKMRQSATGRRVAGRHSSAQPFPKP